MHVYQVGPFQLDARTLLLTHQGSPVPLGPKVVETLLAFVERPGEILSKASLLERVWPEGYVEEANLTQNIHVLRRCFKHYGAPNPIETSARRGYRLTIPVASTGEHRPAAWTIRPRWAMALAGVCLSAVFVFTVTGNGLGHHAAGPVALSAPSARLYQTARYFWNQRSREGVRKSLYYFKLVADAEPFSATGYAGLADANISMGEYCYGTHRPAVYFARASAYIANALALDPQSAEGHAALGLLEIHRAHFALAVKELQLATMLAPSYGPAHQRLGIALVKSGRTLSGVAELETAAKLEPLSVATIAWLGAASYQSGRFSDALRYSEQALELSPGRPDVLATIGLAYEAEGDYTRAIDIFQRYRESDPYTRAEGAALLARAYALAHRTDEARRELHFAREHAADVDSFDLRSATAALGRDATLGQLRPGEHVRSEMFS